MNFWQAVILAVVEGVTEFLPISSTAHLMLVSSVMKLTQTDFVKSFEIAIQLGAILSIMVLYVQKIIKNPGLIIKIFTAFVPTAVIGFGLYKLVKVYLLGNNWIAVGAMMIGGMLLLKFDIQNLKIEYKNTIQNLSIIKLLIIGLFQSLAVVPGVSRALVTIWGGQLVGLSKEEAVEMSFLLAVPTMTAATGLDLIKTGVSFSRSEWTILGTGILIAFLSAIAVVKWLVGYVQKKDFKIFGWYRVGLAILWGGLIYLGLP